jgi:hypothetical protein
MYTCIPISLTLSFNNTIIIIKQNEIIISTKYNLNCVAIEHEHSYIIIEQIQYYLLQPGR